MNVIKYITKSARNATAQGFQPVTFPYCPKEYWMLTKTIADYQRDGIPICLVRSRLSPDKNQKGSALAVWRKTS